MADDDPIASTSSQFIEADKGTAMKTRTGIKRHTASHFTAAFAPPDNITKNSTEHEKEKFSVFAQSLTVAE